MLFSGWMLICVCVVFERCCIEFRVEFSFVSVFYSFKVFLLLVACSELAGGVKSWKELLFVQLHQSKCISSMVRESFFARVVGVLPGCQVQALL